MRKLYICIFSNAQMINYRRSYQSALFCISYFFCNVFDIVNCCLTKLKLIFFVIFLYALVIYLRKRVITNVGLIVMFCWTNFLYGLIIFCTLRPFFVYECRDDSNMDSWRWLNDLYSIVDQRFFLKVILRKGSKFKALLRMIDFW